MTVVVLIFGSAAAVAKADRVSVAVESGATVRDVLAAMNRSHPELQFATASARIAINQEFAAPSTPIAETDELALISLVGGG